MNVEKSVVTKLTISGVKNLDAIAVYVEDYKPGVGKITITCFGESWTAFWSAMGENNDMTAFFCQCDEHYLAGKLSSLSVWIRDSDDEVMQAVLKREIVKRRRELSLDKEKARELWDETGNIDPDCPGHVYSLIFEDEWWYKLPEKRNPQYDYLCRIIKTVQEAFKQLKEEKL